LAESPGEGDPRPHLELACAFFLHYCKPSEFRAFLKRMRAAASASHAGEDLLPAAPAPAAPATAVDSFARGAPGSIAGSTHAEAASENKTGKKDPAAVLQSEDSSGTVALPQLSPKSRLDVRIHPALPIFIREVCGMLNGMRNASSLLRYLEMLSALGLSRKIADEDEDSDAEGDVDDEDGRGKIILDSHSAARLLTTLDALSTPGGPLYPTPAIRKQAVIALKSIFPAGHAQRRLVQCLFRSLHPVALTKATSASWWASVMALIGCSRVKKEVKPASANNGAPRPPTIAATPGLEISPGGLAAVAAQGSSSGVSSQVTSSPRRQLLGQTGRSATGK
jgi:hypothetical protein